MTEQEVLEKVIKKAKNNGYKNEYWIVDEPASAIDGNFDVPPNYYYAIIFSHDFARVFWAGYKEKIFINDSTTGPRYLFDWQCPYSRMVLEENPLRYLEQFI